MSEIAVNVLDAIKQRSSTRAFLDKLVSKEVVASVLDYARFSPSGANLQPWQVAVLMGKSKKTLSDAIVEVHARGEAQRPDFSYYPQNWFEPYRNRRFETGLALYRALGIGREDKVRRQQQWQANYHFFGAPVGHGLATCPQASSADYPDVVRKYLGLPENMMIFGGMAMGYADAQHPVNNYRVSRQEVENFTTWLS